MALYEITSDKLNEIKPTTFGQAGVYERNDLQRLLRRQIEIVAPDVLIVAEEFGRWEDSRRRIDLLGVDKDAKLVVFELKRTEDGGHMELQALRYAGMISTMTFDQVVDVYADYLRSIQQTEVDARASLLEFLEWSDENDGVFAEDIRIVLVSSNFSKELTTAVMWLNQRNLDIRCVRIVPHQDNGRVIVDVQQTIPLPEAADYQVRLREKEQIERSTRKQQSYAVERRAFWQAYIDRLAGELERGGPATAQSNRRHELPEVGVAISLMTAIGKIGIFFTAPRGVKFATTAQKLEAFEDTITAKLGVPCREGSWYQEVKGDYKDPAQWDELIEWLSARADLYEQTIRAVLGEGNSSS